MRSIGLGNQAGALLVLSLCLTLFGCDLFKSHPENNLEDAIEKGIVEVHDGRTSLWLFDAIEESIWVIDNNNALMRSNDEGSNWVEINHPAEATLVTIKVADAGNTVLLVDDFGYLHRSVDAGSTWARVDLTILIEGSENDRESIRWSSFEINNINKLYFNVDCEVFFSADYGDSWTELSEELLAPDEDLCVDHLFINEQHEVTHAAVYKWGAGWSTRYYLYQTKNLGKNWDVICPPTVMSQLAGGYPTCPDNELPPIKYKRFFEVSEFTRQSFDAVEKRVAEATRAIRQSREIKGVDEQLISDLISERAVVKRGSRLWYHRGEFLAFSDDQARKWTSVFTGLEVETEERAVDFAEYGAGEAIHIDGAIVIDQKDGLVITSTDERSWTVLRTAAGNIVNRLLIADDDSPLLALVGNSLVIKTEDDWQTQKLFDGEILKFIRQDESIWVVTEVEYSHYAHYSADSGDSWVSVEITDDGYYSSAVYHCGIQSCTFLDDNEIGFLRVDQKGELAVSRREINVPDHGVEIHDCCNRTIFWSETLSQVWIGYYDTGSLYTSTDQGKNWTLSSNTGEEDLVNTWFTDKDRGLIYELRDEGLRYYIAVTAFEGGVWQDLSTLPMRYKDSLDYACWLSSTQGLVKISSDDEDNQNEPKFFVTNDTGRTWYTLDLPNETIGYHCIRWQDKLEIDDKIVTFKP